MNVVKCVWALTMVGTALLVPPAVPAVQPWNETGVWRRAEVREEHVSADAGWDTAGVRGKIESRLRGPGASVHRVQFSWPDVPEILAPGVPHDMQLGALVLDASPDVRATAALELAPACVAVQSEDAAGTVRMAHATFRAPDRVAGAPHTFDVTVTLSHGASSVRYVYSYTWSPAPLVASADEW
jgi:hypothetical protein